jgi:hypothetical protein
MIVNNLDICLSGHDAFSAQDDSKAMPLFLLKRKLFSGSAVGQCSAGSRHIACAAPESVYVFPAQEIATQAASLDSALPYRNNPVRDRQHLSVCDF